MTFLDYPVLVQSGLKTNSLNYWEQLGVDKILKFLWDVILHVSFQTRLVSLNLKVCGVSYTPPNRTTQQET